MLIFISIDKIINNQKLFLNVVFLIIIIIIILLFKIIIN